MGGSDSPSSSQLWFHIINLAILILYIFIGIRVGLVIEVKTANVSSMIDSFAILTAVVSGIITGNKFANILVNLKYGSKNANDITKPT